MRNTRVPGAWYGDHDPELIVGVDASGDGRVRMYCHVFHDIWYGINDKLK